MDAYKDLFVSERSAVTRLRNYLRINSAHPNPNYDLSIDWIRIQAKSLGLKFNIEKFPEPGEFAVWLTWEGRNPALKTILLNSHIDVASVDYSGWNYEPFDAFKDEKGNIYARGAQDMKSVGVQYLEAIRNLKAEGFQPLRTIHLTFVPDEENGGGKGMAFFVKSPTFKSLNIGVAMDEGLPSPTEEFLVYYAERMISQIEVKASGVAGPSLVFAENNCGEKIQKIINLLMDLRACEKERLESQQLDLGDVTSVNLTYLEGGIQTNVMPPELKARFDIRVTPWLNAADFKSKLENMCSQADVECEFLWETFQYHSMTSLEDSNVWWKLLKSVFNNLNLKISPQISRGSTDMRYLRHEGIPCFGFSPINLTPVRVHDNDEFINEDMFIEGIKTYENIITVLSSQKYD